MKVLYKTETSLLGYHYQVESRVVSVHGVKPSKTLQFVATYKNGELFELSNGYDKKKDVMKKFNSKRCKLEVLF